MMFIGSLSFGIFYKKKVIVIKYNWKKLYFEFYIFIGIILDFNIYFSMLNLLKLMLYSVK